MKTTKKQPAFPKKERPIRIMRHIIGTRTQLPVTVVHATSLKKGLETYFEEKYKDEGWKPVFQGNTLSIVKDEERRNFVALEASAR